MASPHVAGGVALLLQAQPNTNAEAVRSILQNHADPANWFGNPALGFLDNVHRQGAGMLDIDDAILATTVVTPGKLALGESEAGPSAKTLEIWNRSGAAVTYDLSYVNALSTGGSTFAPSVQHVGCDGRVQLEQRRPCLRRARSRSTPRSPLRQGRHKGQYGGYIVLTPQGGGQVLRVPYAGFIGDYQSIVAATPTAFGFPWVSRLTSCNPVLVRGLNCFDPAGSYTNAPGGTFTMADAFNVPQLLVHLDHQVRRMKVEVLNATTGKTWHLAFDLEHLARNSTSTGVTAYPFSGQTTGANGKKFFTVPDGTYVFRISILKAAGSNSNPAHTETLTTSQFTIDRP